MALFDGLRGCDNFTTCVIQMDQVRKCLLSCMYEQLFMSYNCNSSSDMYSYSSISLFTFIPVI